MKWQKNKFMMMERRRHTRTSIRLSAACSTPGVVNGIKGMGKGKGPRKGLKGGLSPPKGVPRPGLQLPIQTAGLSSSSAKTTSSVEASLSATGCISWTLGIACNGGEWYDGERNPFSRQSKEKRQDKTRLDKIRQNPPHNTSQYETTQRQSQAVSFPPCSCSQTCKTHESRTNRPTDNL